MTWHLTDSSAVSRFYYIKNISTHKFENIRAHMHGFWLMFMLQSSTTINNNIKTLAYLNNMQQLTKETELIQSDDCLKSINSQKLLSQALNNKYYVFTLFKCNSKHKKHTRVLPYFWTVCPRSRVCLRQWDFRVNGRDSGVIVYVTTCTLHEDQYLCWKSDINVCFGCP